MFVCESVCMYVYAGMYIFLYCSFFFFFFFFKPLWRQFLTSKFFHLRSYLHPFSCIQSLIKYFIRISLFQHVLPSTIYFFRFQFYIFPLILLRVAQVPFVIQSFECTTARCKSFSELYCPLFRSEICLLKVTPAMLKSLWREYQKKTGRQTK